MSETEERVVMELPKNIKADLEQLARESHRTLKGMVCVLVEAEVQRKAESARVMRAMQGVEIAPVSDSPFSE
jgi:hypothetical protein